MIPKPFALQGMADLASPILFIMQDEALAFWCFVKLMERMEANFSPDSTSMQTQLDTLHDLMQLLDPELHAFIEAADSSNYFFCYRWLLVHFKREFSFDEVSLTTICFSHRVQLLSDTERVDSHPPTQPLLLKAKVCGVLIRVLLCCETPLGMHVAAVEPFNMTHYS